MKEVDIISKVVGRDTSGKTAMYIPGAGAPSVNLDDYLLKKIWDSVFEIRTDGEGNPYLFEKLPFVTQYGITMYANGGNLNLPSIYAGLPIDGSTLIRDANGVLMINPDIDLGGASTWDELIGKPSWIGSTKPSYNYSEILQTPDLSVYALAKDLEKYVTLNTEQTIAAHKNFLNGLSVGGLGITKSQDDVVYIDANLVVRGGITMYATDTVDVPSIIDSLPTASTSAKGLASFDPNFFSVDDNGNVSFIGSTGITKVKWTDIEGRPTLLSSFTNDQGFASTLGELSNVGSWADSAPTQGRFLYQEAGSSEWSYKNISELISQTGAYLPLSGGSLEGSTAKILKITSTYVTTDGWHTPLLAYTPNMPSQAHANIEVGKSSSARNLAWFGFKYDSDGSYDNLLTMGLNSVDDALVINGYGYIGIGTLNPKSRCDINGKLTIRTETSSNRVSSVEMKNTDTDLWQLSARYTTAENGYFKIFYHNGSTWTTTFSLSRYGYLLVNGGITMYSDQRKKTILNHVELTLQQIADAPLIEHYYNSDAMRTTHVGSIAQYWAGLNDWFCKKDSEGFYTMEIQNAALASAISIARELVKYESKTDKEIRLLKDEVKRLKKEIKILKSA